MKINNYRRQIICLVLHTTVCQNKQKVLVNEEVILFILFYYFEMGSYYVSQTDLELLMSRNPPTSAS